MKKLSIVSFTALLFAATVCNAQSNTNSEGKGSSGTETQKVEPANEADKDTTAKANDAGGGEGAAAAPAASGSKPKKPDQYSKVDDPKPMLTTKEAVEKRRKNMTEPDTTMKKGSGSAPRNIKNHTGKTSNYGNQASKRNPGGK
ncbi:hypothetical protein DSL64_22120 [Dyadobacter luteus]|uniref:Uncharacterized protein n=1 Tax=Dyadobacter luteus TaxID=2259619 RepID=A0A3D8Y6Y1_9BACT|nr:hypothetical protein [Dyadobacter luteus]REA58083.1 hypothetical protein DSL64_22120 [Dyadobacter luteus]